MSVQTLERQNENSKISSNNMGLELVVNNQHFSSVNYFSINNRRYLGNKYKLNEFIKKAISKECEEFSTFADLFAGTGEVIINEFNRLFGDINWKDEDKIHKVILEDIPSKAMQNTAYQNAMKNSSEQNAKIELEKAITKIINSMVFDQAELAKQYSQNENFRKWILDKIFKETYKKAG